MRSSRIRPVQSHTPWSTSRRDVLRYGSAALAASLLGPWPRRAAAQTPTTFNYYISTTGSDSNPGTVAAPWAITSLLAGNPNQSKMAGKSIGVMAGTYEVMTLTGISTYPGAGTGPVYLVVPGGNSSSQTILASCNSAGVYAPVGNPSGEWAILDGQGTASNNPNGQPLLGGLGSQYAYVTIDGFEIINAYYHPIVLGFETGGYFMVTTRLPGCVIQNNYIHTFTNSIGGANATGITLYATTGGVIQNNYVTGITDTSSRATGIEIWNSDHVTIQYNTLISSSSQQVGGIFIKNEGNTNNTVRYNYVDLTASGAGDAGSGGLCCDDDAPDSVSSTSTDYFYGNIIIADNPVFWYAIEVNGGPNYAHQEVWYNNTFIGIPGTSGGAFWVRFTAPGNITFYNNILYATSDSGGLRGMLSSNNGPSAGTGSFALIDYNLYDVVQLGMAAYTSGGVPPAPTLVSTLAAWQAQLPSACIGKDAHSVLGTAPSFVGGSPSIPSQFYQLVSGSAGKGSGSTNGQTSGSSTDMGAWGNGTTQVGASFVPGGASLSIPSAPVLSLGSS
jgi:hypothetical protein